MALKLLGPTLTEVNQDGLDMVHACCARLQLPDVLRDALGARIGAPAGDFNIVLLAQLTPAERDNTVDNVGLLDTQQPPQPRLPTLFEKAQIRSVLALVDVVSMLLAAPPVQGQVPAPQAQAAPVAPQLALNMRRVRVSDVLDLMDESLVDPLTLGELNQFYANYRDLKHGDPQEEVEPTLEQVSALNSRVVTRQLAPYGDFSILTPFGRRMAKVLKHQAWLPNRDGSYRMVEVLGPENYDAWYACWRVFACCCLMLRWPQPVAGSLLVVTPAALECYQESFRQLAFKYSECWFLCCKAEDSCRAEHLSKIRHERVVANGGAQVSWSDVIIAAASDDEYWDREVRRPAAAYLARGGIWGEPTAAYEEAPTGLTTKVRTQSSGGKPGSIDDSPGQRKKKTRAEEEASRTASPVIGPASPGGGGGNQGASPPTTQAPRWESHPRRKGRFFITIGDGTEICFSFAKGARDACPEPCQRTRAHVCQSCLGPHRNGECGWAKHGGKGGKGGKGRQVTQRKAEGLGQALTQSEPEGTPQPETEPEGTPQPETVETPQTIARCLLAQTPPPWRS